MALEDYKDIVGGAAAIVTFCQMFSGTFLCKNIYKSGTTNKTSPIPFLGGFVLSILFYQHALLIKDEPMGITNLVGSALHVCYLLFYWWWTPVQNIKHFYKELFFGVALTFFVLVYVRIEDPEKVEFRFGVLITSLLITVIASPLFSLGEIVRTKSTESLSFPMIFFGFLVTGHWLLYGIIVQNGFIIFQNAICFFLCFIQLMLFKIFPDRLKKSKESDKEMKKKKK